MIPCVWFRGAQYLRRTFVEGEQLAVSGRVEAYGSEYQLAHPEYEFVDGGGAGSIHTGAIVPLYSANAEMRERGLRSRGFRQIVSDALKDFLDQVVDDLPADIRARHGFPGLQESLRMVHFPESLQAAELARRRLAFDELFRLQTELARRRARLREGGISFPVEGALVDSLVRNLCFSLTGAQQRCIAEIFEEMASSASMRRLLQGDVGSGKTIVAVCCMLRAVENGYQSVLMAPTEILAEQHHQTMRGLLQSLDVSVDLLTSGRSAPDRDAAIEALRSGSLDMIVGTHALIQSSVEFHNLGVAVVDEQHRFGVDQRSALLGKGLRPDVLIMTATPIPRTLALALYGDCDVSQLDELPLGRLAVRTALRTSAQRGRVLEFIAEELGNGRQGYVVFPLVDESEKIDLRSAMSGFKELQSGPLGEFELALLHGRMPALEKAQVMGRFKRGDVQLLVSTTVVEVGVDVGNATFMMVEQAERFGIAQLHQLRGRVGRGSRASFCILISDVEPDSVAGQRLKTLVETDDGFEIAQRDLELRGPGELLGVRQAGLPEFIAADIFECEGLLELAREEAQRLVANETGALK